MARCEWGDRSIKRGVGRVKIGGCLGEGLVERVPWMAADDDPCRVSRSQFEFFPHLRQGSIPATWYPCDVTSRPRRCVRGDPRNQCYRATLVLISSSLPPSHHHWISLIEFPPIVSHPSPPQPHHMFMKEQELRSCPRSRDYGRRYHIGCTEL